MSESQNRRLLYVVSTQLQLVSCIVLQMTENAGIPADLILMDSSNWDTVRPGLPKMGLFEHIDDLVLWTGERERIRQISDWKVRLKESLELTKTFQLPHLLPYTDMYIHEDTSPMKIIYYTLVHHGIKPDVHFTEEATATYTRTVIPPAKDYFIHEKFGQDSFYKHVKKIYLFEPSCYTGGNTEVELCPITKINALTDQQKQLLCSIYPTTPQIKEKIIFFEGVFHEDAYPVDEYDLLMKIVDLVGKENVIIKRHPRVKVDRYTHKGIKVLPNATVPWEVMLLNQNLEGKLLISVSSFTCMSPLTIYGMEYRAMFLYNLMKGYAWILSQPTFMDFLINVEKQLNSEKQNIWNPKTLKELYIQLDHYIAEEGLHHA